MSKKTKDISINKNKDVSLQDIDVSLPDYLEQLKSANQILDLKDIDTIGLTDAQKKKIKRYFDMFQDYVNGDSITDIAKKHNVTRYTVYVALTFVKQTDYIRDKDIQVITAIQRINARIKQLKKELEHQWQLPQETTGVSTLISTYLKEIRENEKTILELYDLLSGKKKDVKDNKIVIVQNIKSDLNKIETKVDGEIIEN